MWTETDTLAADYVKTHGRHVRDVMTKEVITVNEDTPVAEIAELLESKRIKRVPVLRDGKLVGIVSRANLLHGLAAMPATATAHAAPDEALRNRILSDLDSERWTHTTMMNVIVKDGVAELWGFSGSDVERRASRLVVENVPGVKQVVDHRSVIPAEIAHA
jgi:signal-transduction protein with cAMP-binding, CBS, and nucleotidyltransferase domain